MFDYKSVVSDAEIGFTFEQSEDMDKKFFAFEKATGANLGWVTVDGATFDASDDKIFTAYKLWQTRPERKVGHKIDLIGKNMEQLIEEYEELFIGAYIMQTKREVFKEGNAYVRAIDWLRSTDFYKAPASTQYHDSVPGGLLVHSIKVYNQIVDLLTLPAFKDVKVEEVTLVALMHDWCKIGFYEQYMKNVKDEKTGTWNTEPAYKVNQKGIPLGHGVTSMYLASRVVNLTVEQCIAIRWHNGHFNVAKVEENEYQKAVNEVPMVYIMQVADQLACNAYTNIAPKEN